MALCTKAEVRRLGFQGEEGHGRTINKASCSVISGLPCHINMSKRVISDNLIGKAHNLNSAV